MIATEKNLTKALFVTSYFISMIYEVTSVVGGVKVRGPEFPYIVSLRDLKIHFCAGSILNERWIISAAHCLKKFFSDDEQAYARLTIQAGTYRRRGDKLAHIFRMEHYFFKSVNEDNWLNHDIVLIKVNRRIEYSQFINRINIPKDFTLKDGDSVTAAGWGWTTLTGDNPLLLRRVTLNILGREKCRVEHGELRTKYFICTLNPPGIGLSHGDSGGPIVSANGELVGIIGHFHKSPASGHASFHANVYHYRGWIDVLITMT